MLLKVELAAGLGNALVLRTLLKSSTVLEGEMVVYVDCVLVKVFQMCLDCLDQHFFVYGPKFRETKCTQFTEYQYIWICERQKIQ